MITKTLYGHVSPDTAYIVNDYPYGFRLRTQIRYWLEYKKGQGFRFVSQTLNPKTGEWNKPKPGTYDVCKVMCLDEKNHVTTDTIRGGGWDKEDAVKAFETMHAEALTPEHVAAIKYIRASNWANDHVTVTIGASDEPHQTREEQAAIWNHAIRAGYAETSK